MHLAKLSTPIAIFVSALAVVAMAACSRTQGSPRTQAAVQGRAVYQMYCQTCHEGTNLELIKQPPTLAGLFRNSKLPSGAPATDAEVRKTILGAGESCLRSKTSSTKKRWTTCWRISIPFDGTGVSEEYWQRALAFLTRLGARLTFRSGDRFV